MKIHRIHITGTLISAELPASLKTGGALTADGAEDFSGDFAEVFTVQKKLMDRGKIAHENDEGYHITDCE